MTENPISLHGSKEGLGVISSKSKLRIVSSISRQIPAKSSTIAPTKIIPKPLDKSGVTPLRKPLLKPLSSPPGKINGKPFGSIAPKPITKVISKPLKGLILKPLSQSTSAPSSGKNLRLLPGKDASKTMGITSFSSNRYQIVKVIHEGGFGTVFKVVDQLLKMDVAIKLLKPEAVHNSDALAQLKIEAAVAMKLSHEHIMRLHNIESERGQIFIVMEFVDGQTLREIIDQMGALSLQSVMDIAHSCSNALTYAHEQGVLHRDIKPENIMINQQMSLKLLDFGLAIKKTHWQNQSEYIEGSPGYLSPEQLHGLPLDARTDVFSLAVVICELLTGKRAFPDTASMKQLYDHEPLGIELLPVEVAKVLSSGMARDVNDRYRSVAEFYAAFEQVVRPLIV